MCMVVAFTDTENVGIELGFCGGRIDGEMTRYWNVKVCVGGAGDREGEREKNMDVGGNIQGRAYGGDKGEAVHQDILKVPQRLTKL